MSVFSYPMAAVYDTTGATAVLKVPPGGIPAGSVICVFVYGAFNSVGGGSGLSTQGIGDSAGNVYKFAFTPLDTSMWFLYTYNSKALRGGDTISVRKSGPAQVLGCAYFGLVNTKDPLTTAQMYNQVTTRPVTPAPPGDLVVAAVWSPAYGTGSLYIEDATHPWNPNDFPTLKNYPGDLSDIPMFGTSLQPRPAGSFSWMPQIIPLPAGYGWVSITAGFTAAATTPLISVGFTVGSPALVPGSFSIFGKVTPIGITTASPVIEAPSTGVEAPAVVCLTHRDDPDIQEALFTNTNIALGLEVQPHSLVGRSSDGVGMAERISVVSPLLLVDKLLVLDPSFNEDNDAQFAAILARLAAVEIKAQAAIDGIDTLTDHLAVLTDIVLALPPLVAELQVQVKFIGNLLSLGGGAVDIDIARPILGTPTVH